MRIAMGNTENTGRRPARAAKRRKKNKLLVPAVIVIIIIIAAVAGYNLYVGGAENPYNPDDTSLYAITVPSGATTASIGELLEKEGIIGSASKFKLLAKKEGYDGKFQAGDYSLSPSMSGTELMEALCSGKSNTARFTLPEGLRVAKTAEKLSEQGIADSAEFLAALSAGGFDFAFASEIPDSVSGEDRYEGVLFPETYDVYADASASDVIEKLLAQFDKVFDEEAYARCKELGYTPYQVLTIASIIEKEAKVDQDRELISSVIYNRLAIGQNLEMCSTVLYALGDNKGYVTLQDTKYDSPYNTYMYAGLPPGPICSPGAKSIEAALYPADTDYYYFVVSEKLDGSHNFASTYGEFLKYKELYQEAIGD